MNDEIKFSLDGFSFTWDDAKALANIRKHHVSFEIAAEVLLDKYAVDMYDDLHSENENRYKIIGRIMDKETILSVIYVERVNLGNVELIRIISAREATRKKKERRKNFMAWNYPEGYPQNREEAIELMKTIREEDIDCSDIPEITIPEGVPVPRLENKFRDMQKRNLEVISKLLRESEERMRLAK